jgi:predicted nucleic acid-binding protein
MTIVIDANILIVFGMADEPLYTHAHGILSAWRAIDSASLFRSEITAVVRKVVYQQRITPEQGRTLLSHLLAYPVEFFEDDILLKEAYELAVRLNHPRAYDTQYLAFADRFQCDFWTADERLVNSTQGQFRHIHWLGSWV